MPNTELNCIERLHRAQQGRVEIVCFLKKLTTKKEKRERNLQLARGDITHKAIFRRQCIIQDRTVWSRQYVL